MSTPGSYVDDVLDLQQSVGIYCQLTPPVVLQDVIRDVGCGCSEVFVLVPARIGRRHNPHKGFFFFFSRESTHSCVELSDRGDGCRLCSLVLG